MALGISSWSKKSRSLNIVIQRPAHFDFWILGQPIVRNKCNAHSPAGTRCQHPSKILQGEFALVNENGRFSIEAAVVYNASQYVTPRHPLPTLS